LQIEKKAGCCGNMHPIKLDYINKCFKKYFEDATRDTQIPDLQTFLQHGTTTRLLHSIAVAYYSYRVALLFRMKKHLREIVRGALAHDYYLYDSKDGDPSRKGHGTRHPKIALMNAEKEFLLTDVEKDIIIKHMFPVTMIPPRYKEGVIVCMIDKFCAVYEFLCRRNPYPLVNSEIVQDVSSGRIFDTVQSDIL